MPIWSHGQETYALNGSTVFSMYLRTGQTPPRPIRRSSDVERTNAPRRSYLTVILDRLRDTVPLAARQEIAGQRVTASEGFVPDTSYVKPHRTQCSSILALFTPRFRAAQHHICKTLMITFASQNAGAEEFGSAQALSTATGLIQAGTHWTIRCQQPRKIKSVLGTTPWDFPGLTWRGYVLHGGLSPCGWW
jgi:hypothetical protein